MTKQSAANTQQQQHSRGRLWQLSLLSAAELSHSVGSHYLLGTYKVPTYLPTYLPTLPTVNYLPTYEPKWVPPTSLTN